MGAVDSSSHEETVGEVHCEVFVEFPSILRAAVGAYRIGLNADRERVEPESLIMKAIRAENGFIPLHTYLHERLDPRSMRALSAISRKQRILGRFLLKEPYSLWRSLIYYRRNYFN